MDMTWVTDRIAVGGGIWNDDKMIEVVRAGVTHIIDMQVEFDDTRLAEPYGIRVLWNPTDDDFLPSLRTCFAAALTSPLLPWMTPSPESSSIVLPASIAPP